MAKFSFYRPLSLTVVALLSLAVTMGSAALPAAAGNNSDIALSMTTDRNTIRLGQDVTYTVTATNHGPDDATFVDIAFHIPDQLTLVSMSCDLGISPDGPFCEYASLPAGATVVSTLIATPKLGTASRSRVLTTSVSTLFEDIGPIDPAPANNTASVKTKLVGKVSQP